MADDLQRKLRIYPVKGYVFKEMFTTGRIIEKVKVINGLPEDALVMRILYNEHRDEFRVLVASKEFEPVLDGKPIPECTIEFERIG